MPYGIGESEGQQRVFLGKGTLLVPPLRRPSPLLEDSSSIFGTDDGPPSPCSSATLSCFSTTSDEYCFTPEQSFLKPNLNAFGHPCKSKIHRRVQSFASPCAHQVSFELEPQKPIVSSLYSVNMAPNTKSHEVPVCGVPVINIKNHEPEEVSTLIGLKINPTTSVSKRAGRSCHAKETRSMSPVPGFAIDQKSCGSVGSIPHIFTDAQQSATDNRQRLRNHTPPPDFIDRDSTASDNVELISAPDLSTMLSGAVRSCALLQQQPDFIPLAKAPQDKEKSKSMSDLSKRAEKTKRFLDRRNVIHMDPSDAECCSHTEVSPSSMMTLAMELLVSKNNKAANLFKEAKMKADNASGEKESILPSLWVVPKSESTTSKEKMASHLQPVVQNDNKVTLRRKTSPEVKNNDDSTDFSSSGVKLRKNVSRRSGLVYPTAKCIPLSEQTVDGHREKNTQDDEESIQAEDVERDLKTLTVEDLVGSPDTVYTDTEHETDSTTASVKNPSPEPSKELSTPLVVKIPIEPLGRRRSSSSGRIKHSKLRKAKSTGNIFKKEAKCDLEMDAKKTSYAQAQKHNTSPDSCALDHHVKHVYSTAKRRSSCGSNSSSFTTVSSLSLSSTSTIFSEKGVAKIPTLCHVYDDTDLIDNSIGNEQAASSNAQARPQQVLANLTHVGLNVDSQTTAPRPPRRNKSLGIMDKIRKTGRGREVSSKASRHAMDCGGSKRVQANEHGNILQNDSANIPSSHVTQYGNISLKPCNNEKARASDIIYNSKQSQTSDAMIQERHQSALLISNEARELVDSAPPNRLDEYHNLASIDTHGKGRVPICEGIPIAYDCITSKGSLNKNTGGWKEGTPACYLEPRLKAIKPASVEATKAGVMTTEMRYGNGGISVIDGSRVSLVKPSEDANSDDLHSADFVQSDEGVHEGTMSPFRETPSEEDFVQPSSPTEEDFVQAVYTSDVENAEQGAQEYDLSSHTSERSSTAVTDDTSTIGSDAEYPDQRPGSAKILENGAMKSPTHNISPRPFSFNAQGTTSLLDSRLHFKPQSYPAGYQPQQRHFNELSNDDSSIIRAIQSDSQTSHSLNYEGFNKADNTTMNSGYNAEQANVANRTAVPYGKNSAIKLLTGGPHVYSSSVKITLNRSKSKDNINVKKQEEYGTPPLDFGRINLALSRGGGTSPKPVPPQYRFVRRKSFPMKQESARNMYVRDAITPDMKVSENQVMAKVEAPQHSTVDEGDFAGVVDGPTKNVQEIRAMFKGRDHVNYARPKFAAKKPPPTFPKPVMRPERIPSNPNRNSAEVAQQVIGLFKGALTLDDDVSTTTSPPPKTEPTQNGIDREDAESKASLKEKVANFNSAATKQLEINNNVDEVVVKVQERPTESVPYAEIIKNPDPALSDDGKKSGVKQEKVQEKESYDESLDQFYDVFEELTAR